MNSKCEYQNSIFIRNIKLIIPHFQVKTKKINKSNKLKKEKKLNHADFIFLHYKFTI